MKFFLFVCDARFSVLMAGISSLILTMGLARFSYTPMMPIMQEQTGLSLAAGGWLASINYLGYFLGVLGASRLKALTTKDACYRAGLLVAVVSTAMMAWTDSYLLWAISRFIAGLTSAAGLMLGSALVLNWLMRHGYRHELGIHFSGVGLGIVACTLIGMLPEQTWQGLWWWMTLAAVFLAIPAWFWLPRPARNSMTQTATPPPDVPPSSAYLRAFMLAYAAAGVGYVVSATFIVAIVNDQFALTHSGGVTAGSLTFLLIGFAAAPACVVWDRLARTLGDVQTLILAFSSNLVGVVLPLLSVHPLLMAASAVFFGASFIGIVSLVLTMAGKRFPSRPAMLMSRLTLGYSIAQILAPAITGVLALIFSGYEGGLILAAVAMLVGLLALTQMRALEKAGLADERIQP